MDKEELNLISQAILNEVEGYEFYKMAANQAGTGESKEAFMELANEELKHVDYLKALIDKIKGGESDDIKLILQERPPSPDIYKWEKMEGKHTSLAMSVFSIGIQMEKDSIKFYEDAKAKTKYDEARELFDILIQWEKVHLSQFVEQYDIHKTNWWADQNFAPF